MSKWFVKAGIEFWEVKDDVGMICELESESTARLIAHAPAMLEALLEMLDFYCDQVCQFATPEGKQHAETCSATRAILAAIDGKEKS